MPFNPSNSWSTTPDALVSSRMFDCSDVRLSPRIASSIHPLLTQSRRVISQTAVCHPAEYRIQQGPAKQQDHQISQLLSRSRDTVRST